MNFQEFQESLARENPPAASSAPLKALWLDARGRWDDAHQAVQDDESREAAWVHAYLHRKEGDLSNARYWYARAGRPAADTGLDEEWESLARELSGR